MPLLLMEVASGVGMTAEQSTKLQASLQTYGGALLDNLISLLPALVTVAAIGFVIGIVRKKVRA